MGGREGEEFNEKLLHLNNDSGLLENRMAHSPPPHVSLRKGDQCLSLIFHVVVSFQLHCHSSGVPDCGVPQNHTYCSGVSYWLVHFQVLPASIVFEWRCEETQEMHAVEGLECLPSHAWGPGSYRHPPPTHTHALAHITCAVCVMRASQHLIHLSHCSVDTYNDIWPWKVTLVAQHSGSGGKRIKNSRSPLATYWEQSQPIWNAIIKWNHKQANKPIRLERWFSN